MFLPFIDVFVALFTSHGISAMLQVYLKDHMGATQSDVSMAFMAYSLAYALISVPLGLVSAQYF